MKRTKDEGPATGIVRTPDTTSPTTNPSPPSRDAPPTAQATGAIVELATLDALSPRTSRSRHPSDMADWRAASRKAETAGALRWSGSQASSAVERPSSGQST